MFCPNCGTQNTETAIACTKCGFNLKGASAPKFNGTMLMMNASGAAPAVSPPLPNAQPPAKKPAFKGTMLIGGAAPPPELSPMPGPPIDSALHQPPVGSPPGGPPGFGGQPMGPQGGMAPGFGGPPPVDQGFGAQPPAMGQPGGPPMGFGGPPPMAQPPVSDPAFGGPPPAMGPPGMMPPAVGQPPAFGQQPSGGPPPGPPAWGADPGPQASPPGFGAPPAAPGMSPGFGGPPAPAPAFPAPQGQQFPAPVEPPRAEPFGQFGATPQQAMVPMQSPMQPPMQAPMQNQMQGPMGPPMGHAMGTPMQGPQQAMAGGVGPVGAIRSPMTVLLLSLFTCGFYAMYIVYVQLSELKAYLHKDEINPIFALLPLLNFLAIFKTPGWLLEAKQRAGVPNPQVSSVILYLFLYQYFVQKDLNEIWDPTGQQSPS